MNDGSPATAAGSNTIAFTTPPPAPPMFDLSAMGMPSAPPPTDYKIAEIVLHPGARVSRFEEKAGFATVPDLYEFATPSVEKSRRSLAKRQASRHRLENALPPKTNQPQTRPKQPRNPRRQRLVNRMIGDRQPGVQKKYTFTSPQFYKTDSPLQPSGLLGPVQLITRSAN